MPIERTYKTGRSICQMIEVVGYVLAGFGVIGALASSVIVVQAFPRAGEGAALMIAITAAIPGMIAAALGLYIVMRSQATVAVFDTAEMTRELLNLGRSEREENHLTISEENQSNALEETTTPEETREYTIYQGYRIYSDEIGSEWNGERFENLTKAKEAIDQVMKSRKDSE